MTVEEMLIELHSQLGKPSDLDPYAADGETVDIGSEGAVRLLQWLNRAYRRILTWRFKNGRIIRFRCTEREVYFAGVSLTGTAAAGAAQTITFDAVAEAVADFYNGWAIEITGGTGSGQKRLIVDYSAARVATVATAWDTTPDATSTYCVTKNVYNFVDAGAADAAVNIPLSPTEELIAVMQITDLEDNSVLTRADRTAQFTSIETTIGSSPSVFADVTGGLIFDTTVPDGRYYRIRYFGMPATLTALTDEPEIPQAFQEAVLLWAVWWGLRRQQEFAGAYSTKRDLEDTLETAIQQFDRGSDRDDISFYMEDYYGYSS